MTEEALFHVVLATPPTARAAYLAEQCPDPDMRRRVEELVAAHDRPAGPLEASPATGVFVSVAAANPGTPIFNDLNWGGYLIYFAPGYRVFIDDRCELFANEPRYGRELLTKYDRVNRADPSGFERLLADFRPDVRFALIRRESPLEEYLLRPSSGWRRTATSECGAFFERPDLP